MKKLYIVANWKSHAVDPLQWLGEIEGESDVFSEEKEIIICPAFTLLEKAAWFVGSKNIPLKIGSQDISKYDEGAFTGEVNGKMLKGVVSYVIVGHSERREKLHESKEDIEEKVEQAKKYSITPILCVQDETTPIPQGVEIVAYEPTFAIGTGESDTPENADKVAGKIKDKNAEITTVLYGGSVTSDNVRTFTEKENIAGVLVGSKSLDPHIFSQIIKNA